MGDLWSPRDSMLPPEWEAVHYLFTAAKATREGTVTFVPLLMWMSRDGTGGLTALTHDDGGLPIAVDAGLDMVEEHYGQPAWFAVCVDAYGRVTDPREDVSAEELSDRFVMGDPVVVEQLMLFIAFEGMVRVWRRVYRKTATDGWEWDDAQLMLDPVLPTNGALLEVLQRHAVAPS